MFDILRPKMRDFYYNLPCKDKPSVENFDPDLDIIEANEDAASKTLNAKVLPTQKVRKRTLKSTAVVKHEKN